MAYTTYRGKRVSKPHAAMFRAYEKKYHTPVQLNQGARTIAEQARFWANYKRFGHPLAARPFPGAPHIKYGRDHHANDINYGNRPGQAQHVAAFYRAHGVPVAFNVSTEKWHMDTLDAGKLRNAAAKLSESDPVLKEGSKGGSVITLKKLLYGKGLRDFSGSPQTPNSNRYSLVFGKNTAAAVRRFQRMHKLPTDGEVGPKTWKALRD